jgi:hypothetical protein
MGEELFGLQKSYELEVGGPKPWKEYAAEPTQEYYRLISGPSRGDEAALHRFFELNPAYVPGAFSYPRTGHAPILGVFSKPRLTGEPGYIPVFMWLATATDRIYPIFVEIETPTNAGLLRPVNLLRSGRRHTIRFSIGADGYAIPSRCKRGFVRSIFPGHGRRNLMRCTRSLY